MRHAYALCRLTARSPSPSQVHAVVLNFLPDIDASSPAYTAMEKHGPIFALLNEQLMGHTGHECRRVFGPALGRLDAAAAPGERRVAARRAHTA